MINEMGEIGEIGDMGAKGDMGSLTGKGPMKFVVSCQGVGQTFG